jgi:hypothetical protein
MTVAGMTVAERRSEASAAADFARYAHGSVALGELLHELQRERGISAVYIGSGGRKMAAELTEQRRLTDQARTTADDFFSAHAAELPRAATDGVGKLTEALQGLSGARAAADGLATPGPQVSAYYTATNETLLLARVALAGAIREAKLTRLADAYTFLSRAKEQVGVGRALLASVFSADRFTGQQVQSTVAAMARRDAYLAASGSERRRRRPRCSPSSCASRRWRRPRAWKDLPCSARTPDGSASNRRRGTTPSPTRSI